MELMDICGDSFKTMYWYGKTFVMRAVYRALNMELSMAALRMENFLQGM